MMKKKKNNWPFNFIILLRGFIPFTALSQKSDIPIYLRVSQSCKS